MFDNFDFSVIWRTLPYLFLTGMRFTLALTLVATIFGILFGTLLAVMRLSPSRIIARMATIYVTLMRSLPLVMVIFWCYFLIPYVLQWVLRAAQPIPVGALVSAIVTFSMFEAAYFAEIMRAGIGAVAKGQAGAGSALGLTRLQVMRWIILPQAFRTMLPVLLTQTIVLFQDTSLVYVLSITDFLGAANTIAQRDGRMVEMYLFVAVIYFSFSFCAARLANRLHRRIAFVR